MLTQLRTSLLVLFVLTLVTGLVYPLAVTGLARAFSPRQAAGSLLGEPGRVLGSSLIGQQVRDPGRFWGRPSATPAQPYDAAGSGESVRRLVLRHCEPRMWGLLGEPRVNVLLLNQALDAWAAGHEPQTP